MSGSDFWSRRRKAVAAETRAETEQAFEASQAERSDDEILAELDLPDPETVDDPELMRGFLTDAVPQRIKTRALRRLWRLDPVFANLDGLVDYGEDFTDAATVVENLQTAYQVGRGMLSHLDHLAAEAETIADPESTTDEDANAGMDPHEMITPSPEPKAVAVAELEPDLPEPEDAVQVSPSRRRMAFTFDTAPV